MTGIPSELTGVIPPQVLFEMVENTTTLMEHYSNRQLVSYPTIDFSDFQAGDIVSDLGNGVTVSITKFNQDGTAQDGDAMIFDTANPTGDDFDLGTPHRSFGGPGIGKVRHSIAAV